jgi:hypothetical protein
MLCATFETHAVLLGVNSWSLQRWLGHKRIDETMIYVHFADAHRRPTPTRLLEVGEGMADPDGRVIAMLGARNGIRASEMHQTKKARENLGLLRVVS